MLVRLALDRSENSHSYTMSGNGGTMKAPIYLSLKIAYEALVSPLLFEILGNDYSMTAVAYDIL